MKKNTHPTYNTEATVTCNTCKTVYKIGSTVDEIKVELCANCHPFYTGKQTLVDTDNLVEKFNKKRSLAQTLNKKVVSKKEKQKLRKEKSTSSVTLKDMLSQIK